MNQRSEGVKRLVTVLSLISVTAWVVLILIDTHMLTRSRDIGEWLIYSAGILITYLIPPLIARVIYWVIDGFQQDRST